MLVLETVGRIRREHLVKGKSINEIARDLQISRNTVREVLRSRATSFAYEREVAAAAQARAMEDRTRADACPQRGSPFADILSSLALHRESLLQIEAAHQEDRRVLTATTIAAITSVAARSD